MHRKYKFSHFSLDDKIFYVIVYGVLTLFFILVLYPCIFTVSSSFSSGPAVQNGQVILWPVDFTFDGYLTVLNTPDVWIGYRNTIFYTVVGTIIQLAYTLTAGYVMSRRDWIGRDVVMTFFGITMFVGAGLIPRYILYSNLGLVNNILVQLFPGALSIWNMIIARTFISTSIPKELLEATQMDGGSDIKYFLNIVLPLSKPVIVVLALYYGVGHWNDYFGAMIYLHNPNLYPLQIYLKDILNASQIDPGTVSDPDLLAQLQAFVATIKYALIMVAMIPILCVYPFIQKYFVQGVMIGSIKG